MLFVLTMANKEFSFMEKTNQRSLIKKMTFSAMIAALYFVLCLVEGDLASGFMANVRLAEGFCVFALFVPEVIFGAGIGCFFYNLFFSFGILDAVIGTTATLLGCGFIYFVGRFVKNKPLKLIVFGIGLVVLNAALVPVVLILNLTDELSWASYWVEFGIVAGGEALAVYCVGIPLYFATFKWLPRILGCQPQ